MDPALTARAAILLRPLKASDVQPLESLLRETGVFQTYELDVARELLSEGVCKGAASGYLFQVAVVTPEGVVAGYACYGETPCTEGTFDLYWIATAPERQGAGVASRLLAAAVEDATRRGGRLMVAETEDSPPYQAARKFYATQGFKRAADIADFYRPGVAKVVYTRALSGQGGQ